MISQKMPQVFQIILFKYLSGLILQKAGSGLLSYAKEQAIFALRFFVVKFWNLFV